MWMDRIQHSCLVVILSLSAPLSSHAADGHIAFAGNITSTTCAIDVNGTDSADATIVMPPVSASDFQPRSLDGIAGFTEFYFTLSECTLLDPPPPNPTPTIDQFGRPDYFWSGSQLNTHYMRLPRIHMDCVAPNAEECDPMSNAARYVKNSAGTASNVHVVIFSQLGISGFPYGHHIY